MVVFNNLVNLNKTRIYIYNFIPLLQYSTSMYLLVYRFSFIQYFFVNMSLVSRVVVVSSNAASFHAAMD